MLYHEAHVHIQMTQSDNRRLGARLESICQTTFAAVLTVIVEGHLRFKGDESNET
jgi:hypothetical protein